MDYNVVRDAYIEELKSASVKNKNSLAFIKTPLPSSQPIGENNQFQVISIGGTMIKSAILTTNEGKFSIVSEQKAIIPLLADKNVLCSLIGSYVSPKVKHLAINFAYELRPIIRDGLLDGVLVHSTKEHPLSDLIDVQIGTLLETYLKEKQNQSVKISIANDSVCLSLAGLSNNPWNEIAGVIVGTGTNSSFFLDEQTIVNIESGNFQIPEQSETGKIIDEQSLKPGTFMFEKEVSGAYLFKHYNLMIKQSTQENLISSTEELADIAKQDNDNAIIARQLFERSASLVAAQIAGLYAFLKRPKLRVIVEGNLFLHGWHYQELVIHALTEMEIPPDAISFFHIDNSNIIGGAKLLT